MNKLIALMALLLAGSALADTEVVVGRVECVTPRKQVKRATVTVAEGGDKVRAWFDGNQNRFCVEGLAPGAARVVASGTFRRIIVGSALREEEQPFTHAIAVVVHGLRPDVERIPVRYQVRPGEVRRSRLSVFLGAAFSRERDQNRRWRNVTVASSRPDDVEVAVSVDRNGVLKLGIGGKQLGRALLTFEGDRAVNGSWQHVVRTMEVEVVRQR